MYYKSLFCGWRRLPLGLSIYIPLSSIAFPACPGLIIEKNPVGGAFHVVELPRFECPEKRRQTQEAKENSYWNEIEQNAQRLLHKRRELRVTKIDDDDMASAATRGVT